MVQLSLEEKKLMCKEIASRLSAIRRLLHLSQARFGELAGISRARIIQIENGTVRLSWGQLTSILFVCVTNPRAKEYLYANNVLGARFLQYMQGRDANIPPQTNILVHEGIARRWRAQMDASQKTEGSMVVLSREERRAYCDKILSEVSDLRRVLHMSQARFSELAGISRARLIQLEKKKVRLSWSQMTSILFVCMVNLRAKEYIYTNNILPVQFMQYLQQTDANIPPQINITVSQELILPYEQFLEEAEAFASSH